MKLQHALFQAGALTPRKLPAKLFFFGKKEKPVQEQKRIPVQKISHGQMHLTVIRHPQADEYAYLKEEYNIHPVHLDDIYSANQRPKIDIEQRYIFFVLQFPEFNHRTDRIESKELNFIMTKNELVTVIKDAFPHAEASIEKIATNQKEREKFFSKGVGFLLYQMLDELTDAVFPLVEQIERGLDKIDSEVFLDEARDVVRQISFLRRNLIFFQTILKPQLTIFRHIEEARHNFLDEELKTYFSNITDHVTKQWDRLEDAKELTDNISVTIESYVSFKTNETIRVLTIFSVIMLPLTLLSGIYGMNIMVLPFAQHPYAFGIILLFMASIAYLMLLYFRMKHWI